MSQLLRKHQVLKRIGVSGTTLWQMMREDQFPKPIKLTDGKSPLVAWREDEVVAWIDARERQTYKNT